MRIIELMKNWKLKIGAENDEVSVNLPFDVLPSFERNLQLEYGEFNGYYDTRTVTISNKLPTIKSGDVLLDINGLNSMGDIYINDILVSSVTNHGRNIFDISDYIDFGGKNTIKIVITSMAGVKTQYTGLGVADSIKLINIPSAIHLIPYGVFAHTLKIEDKAEINVRAEIKNESKEAKQFIINAYIFNAKNRRVAKKQRKVKLKAEEFKSFDLILKMSRFYEWCQSDPYLYTATVEISSLDGEAWDSETVRFGITTANLIGKNFCLNGKPLKIKGAIVGHDNGIIGNVSVKTAEKRKFGALIETGYNAVRFVGTPSDAALNSLDEMGLMCVVDLFDVWTQARAPFDGHLNFKAGKELIVANAVKSLRNHPCVIMYSLGNCPDEAYGRNFGYEIVEALADAVSGWDDYRLLTAAAREVVPTLKEIEVAGKGFKVNDKGYDACAIDFGREKDFFKTKTQQYFDKVDVAGYCYLYPRYSLDKLMGNRVIIGLASFMDKAFESNDETDKNSNVIGDFAEHGVDCLGGVAESRGSSDGDIDILGFRKTSSYYREIILGAKQRSYIVAVDPETGEEKSLWNWPRFVGQEIEVRVYSGGEVVALYLDGKLIGRKLAGKVNKHIAVFKTYYYPGKLEAVSFRKGLEDSRSVLETVTAPRALKVLARNRSVVADGDNLSYVEIYVTDKNGLNVPYAIRDVSVTVTGDGELVALDNADMSRMERTIDNTCPVYDGKALAVVRGLNPGKINIKVTSDGLLSAKASIRVK